MSLWDNVKKFAEPYADFREGQPTLVNIVGVGD